jgi:nitrogen regulatory protein PII
MRQVELVIQVETDEQADRAFDALVETAATVDVGPGVLDVFVADDLGTVSRP